VGGNKLKLYELKEVLERGGKLRNKVDAEWNKGSYIKMFYDNYLDVRRPLYYYLGDSKIGTPYELYWDRVMNDEWEEIKDKDDGFGLDPM
jgi:hypothetical protein